MVIAIFRISGKRLAGQTTTFDLIIFISMAVAVQNATLRDGATNALVFVLTVFGMHWATTLLTVRSKKFRHLIRGRPRTLIEHGQLNHAAMRAENITIEELRAGLRKLGIENLEQVRSAHLEETGHISAIPL